MVCTAMGSVGLFISGLPWRAPRAQQCPGHVAGQRLSDIQCESSRPAEESDRALYHAPATFRPEYPATHRPKPARQNVTVLLFGGGHPGNSPTNRSEAPR